MKKIIIIALAALCLCSCGKTTTSNDSEATKRYLEAWVHVQKQKHPEYLWTQTGLGSWILEETQGSGSQVGEFADSTFIRLNYNIYDLDGTVQSTTYASMSQQLGSYDETYYYGPVTMYAKGMYAGLEEVIKGMRKGGRCKVLIPAWLITYNRYDTADGYLKQSSDDIGSTSIYEIELIDSFEYIMQWSADSLGRYLVANFPSKYGTDPVKAVADSSGAFGFYYIRSKAPAEEVELNIVPAWIDDTDDEMGQCLFLECGEMSSADSWTEETDENGNTTSGGFTSGGRRMNGEGYGRGTVTDDTDYNSGALAQTNIGKAIAQGEQDKSDAYFDKIYVAFYDGMDRHPGKLPVPIVDKIEITDDFNVIEAPYSLRINKKEEVDADGQSTKYVYLIDSKKKYNFSFLSDEIPDPRAVFYIDGGKYVCEKLTATFHESTGKSQLIKGSFFKILESI